MPPTRCAAYLLDDLFTPGEAGIKVSGAMGSGPLTHEAIRHWMENTGVVRQPWEIRFLIRLSCEYLVESHRAEKRDAVSPWIVEAPDDDLRAVALDMKTTIRRMAA